MPYATLPRRPAHHSDRQTDRETERQRERERVNAGVPPGSERRQLLRLAVINLLLVLTVAFLIKVVFDVASDLKHPPQSGGVLYIPKE